MSVRRSAVLAHPGEELLGTIPIRGLVDVHTLCRVHEVAGDGGSVEALPLHDHVPTRDIDGPFPVYGRGQILTAGDERVRYGPTQQPVGVGEIDPVRMVVIGNGEGREDGVDAPRLKQADAVLNDFGATKGASRLQQADRIVPVIHRLERRNRVLDDREHRGVVPSERGRPEKRYLGAGAHGDIRDG